MRLGLALGFVFFASFAATAGAHDCTCKYAGGDVKQGDTACIKTSKGKSLARCEMVLNNSSWTVLDQPCEIEQSSRRVEPHAQHKG